MYEPLLWLDDIYDKDSMGYSHSNMVILCTKNIYIRHSNIQQNETQHNDIQLSSIEA